LSPHAPEQEILLKIDDVNFSYAQKQKKALGVLKHISLDIYQGEFLCLLGPSGCGKTTLLRLIAGLEDPAHGMISAPDGHASAPKVGMVFQDLALFPHMSVRGNIAYALRRYPRKDKQARIDEMLTLAGLCDKGDAAPHELSGGQKQRLAVVRALAAAPDLILMDEPFAAQDAGRRSKIRDDVMHILRKAGVAAVLVTHDPEEAMQFADRLAILNDGKIEQIGTPHDVYSHPKNAFVASFFGDVNVLKGQVVQGCVRTSIGNIPAPDFSDGTYVNIIIRPEALKLSAHTPDIDHNQPEYEHAHVRVSERKYLGRSTLVHMDTHDIDHKDHDTIHIHARVPGAFLDTRHDVHDIFLDQSQIFIFEDC